MDIVVIGAGAAGTTAALEARRNNRNAKITVLESGPYTQYSSCALPFVISRHIPSFEGIELHNSSFYKRFSNIDIILNTKIEHIDRKNSVVVTDSTSYHYDSLIIATGSIPFMPPIANLDSIDIGKRTFLFKTLETAIDVDDLVNKSTSAIVIGAGLVGVEMAISLKDRGLDVSIIEAMDTIMPQMIDKDMAQIVIDALKKRGIEVCLETHVASISESMDKVTVIAGENTIYTDICIIACGVRANVALARDAGLEVGMGIVTDNSMKTSDPSIFACGDCCESICAITGANMMSQLGSTAVRQAKVAGTNAAGGNETFNPTYNTSITRIGDIDIAACGLTSEQAKSNNVKILTAKVKSHTLPEYYPGGDEIVIKLIVTPDMDLLGGQVIGKSGVLSRISMLSTAMQCNCGLNALRKLETAYTPPIAPTIDPITLVAENAYKRCLRYKNK